MGAFPMEEKIPRLEKFCCCMDIRTGARNMAIILIILNVLQIIAAGAGGDGASIGWSVFFAIFNIVCWVAVIIGLKKGIAKYLIPAMIVCVFDVVIGVIQAIFFFITIVGIPAGIISLAFAGLTAYFFVCLKNNYDDMSSGAAAEPAPTETKPQNPV